MAENRLKDYLKDILDATEDKEVILSFEDLEGKGFNLPPSANKFPEWWKRVIAENWIALIDDNKEHITFLRVEGYSKRQIRKLINPQIEILLCASY